MLEINDIINAYDKRKEMELKLDVIRDYNQSLMIIDGVLCGLNGKIKDMKPVWHYYPKLFEKEQEDYIAFKEQEELELFKEKRSILYAKMAREVE